jgi:hypothetical protein
MFYFNNIGNERCKDPFTELHLQMPWDKGRGVYWQRGDNDAHLDFKKEKESVMQPSLLPRSDLGMRSSYGSNPSAASWSRT